MSRSLPERPNLDHLKNEAKALLKTLRATDLAAKLTDAQRALARDYGFPTWAKLRAFVQSARGKADPVRAFLKAIQEQNPDAALEIVAKHPGIPLESLHVAAALGDVGAIQRLIASGANVEEKAGDPAATPLLFLCYSPFQGKDATDNARLGESALLLLDAGADPNTRDGQYGVPALFAVTGMHNSPGIARLLLEHGANPTDGESVFHAAERFHEDALILLREFGVQLNYVGEWGNTPLYFLLRWYNIGKDEKPTKGFEWLLANGADPNVASGKERENSLHVAVRRGLSTTVIEELLSHGARVDLKRGDGVTAWLLARRAGYDEVAALLERHGAKRETLSAADELLAACGRGDVDAAKRLASPHLIATLTAADQVLMIEAADAGRTTVVKACIAAGFNVNHVNDRGATALHEAAINGYSEIVTALLAAGADHRVKDPYHDGTAMGWAQFGADFVKNPEGRYEDTVRALRAGGAEVRRDEHLAAHEGVRAVSG